MLLFIEYNFTVVYKPSKTHVVAYALSRLPYITKPTCALDQTTYASMFYTEREWLSKIFFENRVDCGNIINTTKTIIGKESKTFHIEEWWIV